MSVPETRRLRQEKRDEPRRSVGSLLGRSPTLVTLLVTEGKLRPSVSDPTRPSSPSTASALRTIPWGDRDIQG